MKGQTNVLDRSRKREAFLMLLPSVLLLILVSIYPFIWMFRYVFYDYNGFVSYFVGMDNFKRGLKDQYFLNAVLHTFEYAFWKLIIVIPLALILGYILTWKMRGMRLFQGVYFMPTIISSAISGMIFYFIFSPFNGVLNGILRSINPSRPAVDWLGNSQIVMYSVVAVAIWGGFGNYITLMMSGFLGIPHDLYESARIDGANEATIFFRITLPMLGPVLKVVLTIAITTAFKDYEMILVLTQGGPNHRTDVMFSYIYQMAFGTAPGAPSQLGYAATLSLYAAVIVGIITVIFTRLTRNMDDIQ